MLALALALVLALALELVLVMAVVDTARGRVNRSSLWHYDAQTGSWRLRFRQDTAIPG